MGLTFRRLKGHSGHCRLVQEISSNVEKMGSELKAYHVAGKRMDIEGEDGKSRQRSVGSSLPDMWTEAMSSVEPSPLLLWVLEFFLGDLGKRLPWHAQPHEIAGKASLIVGEPYGAATTLSNIREAANMSLSTSVILILPRRMYTDWFHLARKLLCIADFPAGTILHGREHFERLLVYYLPPFRARMLHHDPKTVKRLQDEPATSAQLQRLQAAISEDRRDSYLRNF